MNLAVVLQQRRYFYQPTLRAYDPDTPIQRQNEAWTCSVYAADWALRSLGVESDDETLEAEMLARGTVTPRYGLMDARGHGLAQVLRDKIPSHKIVEVNEAVTWEWLISNAGQGPIALGGRAWNHWSGVRSVVMGPAVSLANPAPGHMQVWGVLSRADFSRLGAWSAVIVR
jgi:hypothetical protein